MARARDHLNVPAELQGNGTRRESFDHDEHDLEGFPSPRRDRAMKGAFIWFGLGIVLALIMGSSLPRAVWDWMAPTLREESARPMPPSAPAQRVLDLPTPPCPSPDTLYALLNEQNELLQHMLNEPRPTMVGPSPQRARFLELDRKLLELGTCPSAPGKGKRS